MIRLRFFLLLLLLMSGCKDSDTEEATSSISDVSQETGIQTANNNINDIEYSYKVNIEEILAYSIPDNAEEVEGPPVSDGGSAIDYMLDSQLVGRKVFYSNGNNSALVLYKDGKMHGPHRAWYENRQLRFEMFYDMGVQCHWSRQWHDNGQLKTEIFIKDGIVDGLYRQWNKDGELLGEFEYSMGSADSREWHENGNVKRHIQFIDGYPHGIWKEWDENGNFLEDSTRYFLNGKEVEETAYYEAKKTDTSLPDFDEVGK